MALVILYSVCAIIAITSTVSGEEGGTCTACNCQFNNVEVLDQLIESKIASGKLATTTVKPSWCQRVHKSVVNDLFWSDLHQVGEDLLSKRH